MIRLYHGSNVPIDEIDLSKSKTNKDFGCGFYLSDNEAQALELAKFKVTTLGGSVEVSIFEFDDKFMINGELKIKTFYGYTKEWAEFILSNRKNFSRNQIHDYDIVYGPIADDKVGAQIRRLENGDIDLTEFMKRVQYAKGVTFQYFFGTERAVNLLHKI